MRCCPFWGAIYAAGAAQLAVYGFASVAIGFATQASVFTGAAWWLWLALVAAQIHCAMGLVVLVAALAPSRRLLALGTSFGLLISIVVAMVICSVMVAQQGPADVPQRFFSWPWFLLVFPLFAYPRAVFVLMAYGTQSGTAPFTDPSEAAVEVYIVVALLFAVGTIAGVVGIYFFAVLPAQVRRARVVPMSCSSRGNVSWRQIGARWVPDGRWRGDSQAHSSPVVFPGSPQHAKWTASATDPMLCLGEGGCVQIALRRVMRRRRRQQRDAAGARSVPLLSGTSAGSGADYGGIAIAAREEVQGGALGGLGHNDIDVLRSREEAR